MVVLGPGTGLGQAVLTWDGAGAGAYKVWPSEGSHADFAPRGELQRALAAAAEAELGECEVEQVCCGVRLRC
jgi:glucokinase